MFYVSVVGVYWNADISNILLEMKISLSIKENVLQMHTMQRHMAFEWMWMPLWEVNCGYSVGNPHDFVFSLYPMWTLHLAKRQVLIWAQLETDSKLGFYYTLMKFTGFI